MSLLNSMSDARIKLLQKEQLGIMRDAIIETHSGLHLNPDGSYDCHGDLNISSLQLTEIPLRLRYVYGDFIVSANFLEDLMNCPIEIGGNFYFCSNFLLKSFQYFPKKVNKDIQLFYTKLLRQYIDLKAIEATILEKCEIGGTLSIFNMCNQYF